MQSLAKSVRPIIPEIVQRLDVKTLKTAHVTGARLLDTGETIRIKIILSDDYNIP